MIHINHTSDGCCSTCEELKQAIRSQAVLQADNKTLRLTDRTQASSFKTYWEVWQNGKSLSTDTVEAGGTTDIDISMFNIAMPLTIKQRDWQKYDNKKECDVTIEKQGLLCCGKTFHIGDFGMPTEAVKYCTTAQKDSAGIVISLDKIGLSNTGASITALGNSANGATLTLTEDGSIFYKPAASYTGKDSFEYTLTDVDGNTSTAMITVFVGIEIPDIAVNVSVGIEIEFSLVPNGFVMPCDCAKFVVIEEPMYGTIIPDTDGVAFYTPNEDASGKTDVVKYGIQCEGCDIYIAEATATINIGDKVCPETDGDNDTCMIDGDVVLATDTPINGQVTVALKNLTGITGTPSIEIYQSNDMPAGENAGDSFEADITNSSFWGSPISNVSEITLPYKAKEKSNYFAIKVTDDKCERIFYLFFDEQRYGTSDYASAFSKDGGMTWMTA